MTKRVVVQMSDECHAALKQYAAFYGMPMSEVLYQCTRMQLHTQRQYCEYTDNVLRNLGIKSDKRANKPCFDFRCFNCKHVTACKAGLYEGVTVFREEIFERDVLTKKGVKALIDLQRSAGQKPQLADDDDWMGHQAGLIDKS